MLTCMNLYERGLRMHALRCKYYAVEKYILHSSKTVGDSTMRVSRQSGIRLARLSDFAVRGYPSLRSVSAAAAPAVCN